MSQGRTQVGPKGAASGVQYIFLYSYYIFYFCSWTPFQNLRPLFSSISLTSLTQIATIQSKNLTKIIKTFTMIDDAKIISRGDRLNRMSLKVVR